METKKIFDTNVAINKKEGVITIFSVIEHPPSINKFEIIFPESTDYIKAVQIAEKLREKGTPIGAINIIISAMCMNRNTILVTKDKDYKNVENIFPEFKLNLE